MEFKEMDTVFNKLQELKLIKNDSPLFKTKFGDIGLHFSVHKKAHHAKDFTHGVLAPQDFKTHKTLTFLDASDNILLMIHLKTTKDSTTCEVNIMKKNLTHRATTQETKQMLETLQYSKMLEHIHEQFNKIDTYNNKLQVLGKINELRGSSQVSSYKP